MAHLLLHPSRLVPRTVKSELNTWFAAAMATSEPTLAVILGERYDGKTWLVFDWLKDTLATLPVPVFFIGSKRGKSSAKDLADHILEDIKRVLGSFERHASTTLKRQRDIKAGSTPWCVIILDGLNEYAPNPDRWLAHLTWATGRTDLDARPCVVIATVRQRSWPELADRVRMEVQEIHIGSYDDAEFRLVLKLQELPADYLQAIPENARVMVRRPRYFDLVIKHKDKLGRYDAITPAVLHWLDLCDKIRSRRAPASGWDEEHFQGVLMGLAARCNLSRSLQLREIRSLIAEFTSDIEAILHDLRSAGVLIRTGTGYRLAEERFALGRGLYLLEEELCTAYEHGEDLDECLKDFLATLRETEEMVACLRVAATVALFSDPPKPEAVIDVLVYEWLGSRNLSPTDFQEIRALHHRLLHPLLRLAPKVWSAKRDEEGLQELSRMVFTEALANHRHLIGDAIRSWFRLVPTAGSALFQRRMEDPASEIRIRTADPNIIDLHLKEHGDEGILMLHRFGLYLLSKVPDLVGPDDLLALMAAQEIAGDYPRDGDCFVIRRALAHTSVTWFEEQMRRLSRDPTGRRREILYWLITCAAREDLQAFEEATKPATDPWQELQHQLSLYDRARYDELRAMSFSSDDDPARFVELARDVVRDPDLPKPCRERITALSEVLLDTFSKASPPASQVSSGNGLFVWTKMPSLLMDQYARLCSHCFPSPAQLLKSVMPWTAFSALCYPECSHVNGLMRSSTYHLTIWSGRTCTAK